MAELIRVTVNGTPFELDAAPERSLLLALREELGLTGAKMGCGEGECGACTILLDGAPARACQAKVADAAGRTVRTVEGLASNGRLHPVQAAFREVAAFQCGYCTAGMIMSTVALLERDADPDDGGIKNALVDNICRCCTYPRIVRAVRRAAELARDPGAWAAPEPQPSVGWSPEREPRPERPWDLTPLPQRDYFGVLPEGLMVVLEPGERAPAAGWTTSSSAWLHVAADGLATAFTGKVDVGQDNRTALSMLVADALGAALTSVRLVMGDTDVCPFDLGTFGSRSMPDAGSCLRQVAAAARETLIALAADRWGCTAGEIEASEGHVRRPATHDVLAYGHLVRGTRRVESASTLRMPSPPAERLVGSPTLRVSGAATVTGAKRFPSDLSRPGMLHGRVMRPPANGASPRAVDTTRAAAVPGVTVVQEGSFVGIVAPDPPTAGRALAVVDVDWALAPAPSEVELWDHLRGHPIEEEGWEGPFHHESGDLEAGLAAASTRLSATYATAYIAHVPLETHVAVAEWAADGRLTVWTGTQVPFGVRRELGEALGVPEARVRVVVPDTGGGFGGKHAGEIAIEAARLSRAVGRPVKVRWSRQEEFTAGYVRPAALIDIRSGADARERISAWEMRNTNAGMFGLVGPYQIPHQRLDFQPADSPLPQGSYRALAATANHFARESHIDELAHAIDADPLELRLAHLQDERLVAVLRAAAARIDWGRPRERGRAVGIACGVEKGARVATSVEVSIEEDRRLEILRVATAFECGAIVNPDGLANQVEGAVVMGLGAALFETVHFAAGAITNASLAAYRVPRITDVPPVDVVLLDRRDLASAGAGETPIIAIAPALANAIFAATGVRLRTLPLAPDGRVPDR